MTKKQVAEILGYNTINDPFLSKDRWDYLLKKNKINEFSPSVLYHLTVNFSDDLLESFQIKKLKVYFPKCFLINHNESFF